MSSPYNNKTLAPVEELYARVAPVNGIPRPHYLDKDLISREVLSERKQRAEHTGSNPEARPFTPEDQHTPTQEENDLSADWVEKINGEVSVSTDELTCGDRVYYIDHQKAAKGPGRWRTGVIIKRKKITSTPPEFTNPMVMIYTMLKIAPPLHAPGRTSGSTNTPK